jgi:glutathione synthase/RimK-type ligase-like ATP-grasp enzyme
MKRLFCIDDRGGWGRSLATEAEKRGWSVRVGSIEDADKDRREKYLFVRTNQGGERMKKEKVFVHRRSAIDKLIIGLDDTLEYEDKLLQASTISPAWMPRTYIITKPDDALRRLNSIDLPFISKSKTGSASRNVRFIETRKQAEKEIEAAFGTTGLVAPHKLGEGVQRGYLLWQEFLPNNAYDYRVCKIGDSYMMLRRHNREDLPFASGSGRVEPVTELDDETASVLEFSTWFFKAIDTKWCGIDVVKDKDGRWKVLETTIGWSQPAYSECRFFDLHGKPSKYRGQDIWKVAMNAIERGVFG